MRCAVIVQATRIRAPIDLKFNPGFGFRLGGPGRFLRGRELVCARRALDDDKVVVRPFPQPSRALRPRPDALGGDGGDLGHPGQWIHRTPFHA
jgi:hypothetical protein